MKLPPEAPVLATGEHPPSMFERAFAMLGGRRGRIISMLLLASLVLVWFVWPWLRAPQVRVGHVIATSIAQTVVASGRVETPRRIDIGSQLTGTVVNMPVNEGQAVRAGDTLIVLEQGEALAAVDQARAAVSQAELKLQQIAELSHPLAVQTIRQAEVNRATALRQWTRSAALFARGFIGQAALEESLRNFEQADSQFTASRLQEHSLAAGGSDARMARAALEQARAALRLAQVRLSNTVIRAPVDGVLIARSAERGSVVQPGKVLLVLSPDGPTQLVLQIDEKNMAMLRLGQTATASADAYPDGRFDGVVSYINPGVDAQRGAVEVKLDVPRPPPYLRQDMTVSVEILVASKARSLVIPALALHDSTTANTAPWVWKVQAGRVVRQPVVTGISGTAAREILAGLRVDDLIVVEAGSELSEGQRIRPLDQNPRPIRQQTQRGPTLVGD